VYKLKITVERIDGYCSLPMLVGDSFILEERGKIMIPEGKFICMWALQSMMPILPILQRTEPRKGEWTSLSGVRFSCPDPDGRVQYRIERIEEE